MDQMLTMNKHDEISENHCIHIAMPHSEDKQNDEQYSARENSGLHTIVEVGDDEEKADSESSVDDSQHAPYSSADAPTSQSQGASITEVSDRATDVLTSQSQGTSITEVSRRATNASTNCQPQLSQGAGIAEAVSDRATDGGISEVSDRATDGGITEVSDRATDGGITEVSDRATDADITEVSDRATDAGITEVSDRATDSVTNQPQGIGITVVSDRATDTGISEVSDRVTEQPEDRWVFRDESSTHKTGQAGYWVRVPGHPTEEKWVPIGSPEPHKPRKKEGQWALCSRMCMTWCHTSLFTVCGLPLIACLFCCGPPGWFLIWLIVKLREEQEARDRL
ncbi:S-antigen protein-like [Littorina saxatilis]|uniref:Uncharacterized protein n=1 Tax=Littorina saxatilis TaxID=31220 RepID=A0AAN9C1C4_9CAEN